VRRAAALVIASLLALGALAPAPAVATAAEEGELLSLVNGVRATRGLRPLVVHAELRALADEWARRMAAAHDIFHSSLDTRVGADWVRLGENVAVDLSVEAAEHALEASPEHLANLVSPSYDYIGIGVVRGTDGGVYVVQEFMRLASGPPQLPSPPKPAPPGPRLPIAAPVRRAARPSPRPSSSAPPAPPTARPVPPPPPPAPPPAPRLPSVRLSDVFDRLRGFDAVLTPPREYRQRGYGLVRRNS
jgi:hypothetical protein